MHALLLIVGALSVLLTAASAGHALLYKRDPRAALGWMFVCIWLPFLGPLAYGLFGLNRIATRARRFKEDQTPCQPAADDPASASHAALAAKVSQPLARMAAAVTGLPLTAGNQVEALHNGEEAYPAMLEAIDGARESVYLSTYLFGTGDIGRAFIGALERAKVRGVRVRVIVDGVGEKYSRPRASRLLRRRGVPVARFLPPRLIPPAIHINLRTHRKILTVDGLQAFTGGMNLGRRHLAADLGNPDRVIDIHFRLRGAIVGQIEESFRRDWALLEDEFLEASDPPSEAAGEALARIVPDGPDGDLDKLNLMLLGAISAARHRLTLMTPYFLPPREMIAALNTAAIRGVAVTILLPGKNNLPYVHWATRKMLWELLQHGVRIFYQPPPFVHSKLFLVDDDYLLLGSANLDPRSLRLNFELNVEVYDPVLVEALDLHVGQVLERSQELSLEEIDARGIPERLRDAACWLFSPYL